MVFYRLNIYNKWHYELKKDKPDIPQIFVGTKIDLREDSKNDKNSGKNAPIITNTVIIYFNLL